MADVEACTLWNGAWSAAMRWPVVGCRYPSVCRVPAKSSCRRIRSIDADPIGTVGGRGDGGTIGTSPPCGDNRGGCPGGGRRKNSFFGFGIDGCFRERMDWLSGMVGLRLLCRFWSAREWSSTARWFSKQPGLRRNRGAAESGRIGIARRGTSDEGQFPLNAGDDGRGDFRVRQRTTRVIRKLFVEPGQRIVGGRCRRCCSCQNTWGMDGSPAGTRST